MELAPQSELHYPIIFWASSKTEATIFAPMELASLLSSISGVYLELAPKQVEIDNSFIRSKEEEIWRVCY